MTIFYHFSSLSQLVLGIKIDKMALRKFIEGTVSTKIPIAKAEPFYLFGKLLFSDARSYFLWKLTDIAALIFYQELSSPIKRNFYAYISWNAGNRTETSRTIMLFSLQETSVDSIKVLATFHKIFSFGYLKN